MSVLLGLDIGTNSVGSAWVDTDREEVHLGVSVFPAGVDEQETRRGDPKNQAVDRRGPRGAASPAVRPENDTSAPCSLRLACSRPTPPP